MTTAKTAQPRSYSTDRACFGLSRHIYSAFLREKGADHRDTQRYRRKAAKDASYLIAAGC